MKAQQAQADASNQLAQEQFDWAKQAYASDKTTTDAVAQAQIANMDQSTADAKQSMDRYNNTFVPLQDQYIQQAEDYNTPARRDLNMGQAQGAVATQFDAARRSAQQDLESYGINPSATRYQALDIGTRTQQAAATAAAGTNASLQTEATGNAMLANAANMGSGLPAQAESEYGTATNSGNSATSNTLNQTASGANTMGTSTQYTGIAANALGAESNTMNSEYQNQLAQYNANQQSSSGWGSALGLVGGIVAKSVFHLADGGAVPISSSPSQGAKPDDVNANLSGGEFVMPPDAVRWFGEKTFYGMVDKANKERSTMAQQTGAIPSVGPNTAPGSAPMPPPPYMTAAQPRQAAIPLG